jgi:hypothetical protein
MQVMFKESSAQHILMAHQARFMSLARGTFRSPTKPTNDPDSTEESTNLESEPSFYFSEHPLAQKSRDLLHDLTGPRFFYSLFNLEAVHEICLEDVAGLFAERLPPDFFWDVIDGTPLFQLFRLLFKKGNSEQRLTAVFFLLNLFRHVDFSYDVLSCLVNHWVIPRLLHAFRALRSSQRALVVCCPLAEKLVLMVDDASFTDAILSSLVGCITFYFANFGETEFFPEVWSFFAVLARWRSRRFWNLMKFVVPRLLKVFRQVDFAALSPDCRMAEPLEIITLFSNLFEPEPPIWLKEYDLPPLILAIFEKTRDEQLAEAALRLLTQHATLVPFSVTFSPDWICDLLENRPELVNAAMNLAITVFSEAETPEDWFDCAVYILGFDDNAPRAPETNFLLKQFYTMCISVCSKMIFPCILPPSATFLPFLFDLVTSCIDEQIIISEVLDLLLLYIDMCDEDVEAAAFLLRVLDDQNTHDALSNYLKAGYAQVTCIWHAGQRLAAREDGWNLE